MTNDLEELKKLARKYSDAIKAHRDACGVGVIPDSAAVLVAGLTSQGPEATALEAARIEYRRVADPRTVGALIERVERAEAALKQISLVGGNMPDERFETKTGPNDAMMRGGMFVTCRAIARAALNPNPTNDLKEQTGDGE